MEMNWSYEICIDESYADIDCIDEWGMIQVWLEDKGIGAEYNYCVETYKGEKLNSCAFYFMWEDKEADNWKTDWNDYEHYEIDFNNTRWKEDIVEAMKEFIIKHIKEDYGRDYSICRKGD